MDIRSRIAAAVLLGGAIFACVSLPAGAATDSPAAAGAAPHHYKVVFQISDEDPKRWNLALGNVRNVQDELGRNNVDIELVAYGPGIGLLKFDSELADRLGEAIDRGVRVVACENTMQAARFGRDDMLPRLDYVKAGVVEILDRQAQGCQYVRP